MRMHWWRATIVSLGLLAITASSCAYALVVAMPAGPARIAQADTIVTGRVVAIQDQDVKAAPAPGAKSQVVYRIAVVQVGEALKGKVKNGVLRVGFPAPRQSKPPQGGIKPVRRPNLSTYRRSIQLTQGQAGLFFLTKHHSQDFHIFPMFGMFVADQNQKAYQNELQETKRFLKVLTDPMAGLKSKNRLQRLETAYVLITLYRSPQFRGGPIKQVPIGAEESKLILKALVDADWNQASYKGNNRQMNPWYLFNRIGVGSQDGLKYSKNPKNRANEARAWLKENWQTYQIKKLDRVPGKGGQSGGPQPAPLPPVQILPGKIQPRPVQPGQVRPNQGKQVPQQIQPGQIQLQPLPVQRGQVQPKASPKD